MSKEKSDLLNEKVPIEVALDRAGFGLYSYILIGLAGVIILSSACVIYGTTILVPASACELQTTPSQQGLLVAAPVVGSILGSAAWGYLADTKGRRKMLMTALIGAAIFNGLASLSINWIMLMILQFIATMFVSGMYSMSMSILSESVPLVNRNLVVLLVTSIFLLSQGIMAVLAIPIIPLSYSYYMPVLGIYWNSWRTLLLVYSAPSLISLIWIYFMKESPKFVYAKGDEDQALEILRTIHRINHLRSHKELEVTSILKDESKVTQSKDKSRIMPMFKPPLLKYTVLMTTLLVFQQMGAFMVWLPTIADQFVRVLETGEGSNLTLCDLISASANAPADPNAVPCALNITALLIVLAVGAMQSIINMLLSLIVNKVGRRYLVMIISTVCGISGILVNLMPNAAASVAFFAVQLMGFIVLGMHTAIIVSLFPTHMRAIALALPLTGDRIGTFASIQILNIMLLNNCEAGFYLFASIFTCSVVVASFLPDDRRSTQTQSVKKMVEESLRVNNETNKQIDVTYL